MSYNITLTNGTNLTTVADGTTDTSYTSLTLIGKNFAGYGAFLNENFVKLLENFSNSTAPTPAIQGQIWWDSTNKVMKVYTGTVWKAVSSSTSAATQPASAIVGDLWWDTANGQLKVYSGSAWVVIGPAYTATQGQTGAVADVVSGSGDGLSHVIVKFYISNTLVAVLSKDASFAVTSLPGFTTINPGFNLASLSPTLIYSGLIEDALKLGGVAATNYLQRDGTNTISGTILPSANNTINLGATGTRFNTVYATTFNGNASTANYADLAERFESDAQYIPGTVVELGGEKEVTSVVDDLSENVFGVISTNAAYLMNNAAGSDETHPAIAVQGRVPVRVIGKVKKGDRLVSAGNGLARAAARNEISAFNVIGRSLENKTTAGEGTIEAIVKLNS